jgi:PTH1 family peptidyl-tRNA hydrolase
MKIIVGLGNPGREYQGTRHNIGFKVVDILSKRHKIPVKARRDRAFMGEGTILGEKVILLKPITYMNLSGEAVAQAARRYRADAADILVICDDVNLPLGRLRVRVKGSAGGHNGLKSIIHSLRSDEFPRIRVGIGSTSGDMVDHVLSRFHPQERRAVHDCTERAADAVECALAEGIDAAMNKFNAAPCQ